MHAFVRRALQTALVTGGLVAVGAGAASASEGLLGDLGIDVPIDVSIDVSNIGVGVLGDSSVVSHEETTVIDPAPAAPATPAAPVEEVPAAPAEVPVHHGEDRSLIGDIGINVPVTVPVDVKRPRFDAASF